MGKSLTQPVVITKRQLEVFKRYRKALKEIEDMGGMAIYDGINLHNAVVTAKIALNPRCKFKRYNNDGSTKDT